MRRFLIVACFLTAICAAREGAAQVAIESQPAQEDLERLDSDGAIDHWIGDFRVKGTSTKSGGLNLNNGGLSFRAPASEPIAMNAGVKLWIPADGIPRLQAGKCVSALFPDPRNPGATWQTGGYFVEDYAYAGSDPTCGGQSGDVDMESWLHLDPNASGVKITSRLVRKTAKPDSKKLDLQGEGLLRPVYRPKPAPRIQASIIEPTAQNRESGLKLQVYDGEPIAIEKAIDAIVAADAQGWLLNTYDRGSVFNAGFEPESKDKTSGVVFGEYTYNGGSRGWIRVKIARGEVVCMEYWDFSGQCRPAGQASYGSQLAMSFLTNAIFSPVSGPSGNPDADERVRLIRECVNGDPEADYARCERQVYGR